MSLVDSEKFLYWVNRYEKKTGVKFVADKRYGLFFLPDKGFCEIATLENMVVARCMCGDITFWREKIEDLAHKLNYSMCGTWCIRRQIKAYIRLLGYKIIKEDILSDGKSRYECINNNGGKGWVSPAFTDIENGIEGYFVTWEP